MSTMPPGAEWPAHLRASVLDAVRVLLVERGWSRTTITDVAAAAGVSRQDVYAEFGTRKGLAEAYVMRDVSRMLDALDAAIRRRQDRPAAAVESAFEIFLRLAAREPVIQIIVSGVDEGGLLGPLTTLGREIATERYANVFQDVWPGMARADIDVLSDCLVRLSISHAIIPTADPIEVAHSIGRILTPFLHQALPAHSIVS